MTLHQRTLAIIGPTILILTVILLMTANRILLAGFDQIERQETEANVRRAQNVLAAELANLDDFAQDWAFWDDTYQFIEQPNDQYLKKNWVDSTFVSERLNAVLIIDNSGKVVYQEGFSLEQERTTPLPDGFDGLAPQLLIANAADKVSGIVMLPGGPMLIAARPVLDSNMQLPVNGTVIIGRYLNETKLAQLAGISQLNLTIEPFNSPNMPEDFAAVQSQLTANIMVPVLPLSGETIAGYSLVSDIHQNPALILKVELPRYIYQQGQITLRYLIFALLAIGLVFGLAHFILIKKVVLDRVAKLSRSVLAIGQTGNPSAKVIADNCSDELSNLAGSINNMLHSLELAEYELRTSEALNRMLLEKLPDSILLIAEDGTILDFKTGKHRSASLPPLLFPGKKLSEVYDAEVAARFMVYISHALETRQQQVYEQQIKLNNLTVFQEIRIDVSDQGEVIAIIRDFQQSRQSHLKYGNG